MKLKNIHFGPIACAVGARGFFGEGYPFHKIWQFFGLGWSGTTFAGKTMTAESRTGNMPLKEDGITPTKLIPPSIWVQPKIGGHMLNCIGLSNYGIRYYLNQNKYQKMSSPFFISIMAVGDDPEGRSSQEQISYICNRIEHELGGNKNFGIQINLGCPNTGHDPKEFFKSLEVQLTTARKNLSDHIPIIANFNPLVPIDILLSIQNLVDGYWIGNTIPAGSFDTDINWSKFGVSQSREITSPLTNRGIPGAGGLSGPACLPYTLKKVEEMRSAGIKKPICAGNGIRTTKDVQACKDAGADMVFIGSVAVTKPWAMRGIIRKAHEIF